MATTVITGSASGIGAATYKRFKEKGDNVIGIDIQNAEIVADLATINGREAALKSVNQRCDSVDHFVACAGLTTYNRPSSLIVSVNYFGTIALLDGLFDLLQRGSNSSAVIILSNSAQWLQADETPYVQALLAHDENAAIGIIDAFDDQFLAASLAYVGSKLALGKGLRRRASRWGKRGVRLNGVAPGNTKTPMLQKVMEDPNTRDGVLGMEIPLGRLAETGDIVEVIAFLCSPQASYVHGSIIYADGGVDANVRPDRF